jgi:hypothetical protein
MSKQSALFEREKVRFHDSTEFAIAVSKVYAGREANIPIRMASYRIHANLRWCGFASISDAIKTINPVSPMAAMR